MALRASWRRGMGQATAKDKRGADGSFGLRNYSARGHRMNNRCARHITRGAGGSLIAKYAAADVMRWRRHGTPLSRLRAANAAASARTRSFFSRTLSCEGIGRICGGHGCRVDISNGRKTSRAYARKTKRVYRFTASDICRVKAVWGAISMVARIACSARAQNGGVGVAASYRGGGVKAKYKRLKAWAWQRCRERETVERWQWRRVNIGGVSGVVVKRGRGATVAAKNKMKA